MLKEKNPLLHMKLKNEKKSIFKYIKKIKESLYLLFSLILENPIENIWYECISIILGYLQIILYLFDKTIS